MVLTKKDFFSKEIYMKRDVLRFFVPLLLLGLMVCNVCKAEGADKKAAYR